MDKKMLIVILFAVLIGIILVFSIALITSDAPTATTVATTASTVAKSTGSGMVGGC